MPMEHYTEYDLQRCVSQRIGHHPHNVLVVGVILKRRGGRFCRRRAQRFCLRAAFLRLGSMLVSL